MLTDTKKLGSESTFTHLPAPLTTYKVFNLVFKSCLWPCNSLFIFLKHSWLSKLGRREYRIKDRHKLTAKLCSIKPVDCSLIFILSGTFPPQSLKKEKISPQVKYLCQIHGENVSNAAQHASAAPPPPHRTGTCVATRLSKVTLSKHQV